MSVVALLLVAALGGQDPAVAEDCLDDNHTNRCDVSVQARTRSLLGAASIEEEAATSAEIYRAFFVDGYGRDMPAVSFERRAGQSPNVVILGSQGRRVSAPIHLATWEHIQTQARFADRQLQPLPSSADRMCLHAWVTTVEIANSYLDHRAVPVRKRTEDACGSGLTMVFALELAKQAVAAIPACRALVNTVDDGVRLLETCLSLRGDTVSAATLLAEKGRPTRYGVQEIREVDWMLWVGVGVQQPRLDWSGEVVQERNWSSGNDDIPPSISEFVYERARRLGGIYVEPEIAGAESATSGWIEGTVSYYRDQQTYRAPSRQVWVREGGSEWSLKSWTVGAFSRATDE
jgi:hypothetical protein